MNRRKVLTLVLLSLVLALVGSIIIVSGMLDENEDSALTFMQGDESDPEVLGFKSTTDEEEGPTSEPLIEEAGITEAPEEMPQQEQQEQEIDSEPKSNIFDTFVPDQPTQAPQPTAAPTAVETMPEAGILDDYSKYVLILAPILIVGALIL
jgi:hypothetical protein